MLPAGPGVGLPPLLTGGAGTEAFGEGGVTAGGAAGVQELGTDSPPIKPARPALADTGGAPPSPASPVAWPAGNGGPTTALEPEPPPEGLRLINPLISL